MLDKALAWWFDFCREICIEFLLGTPIFTRTYVTRLTKKYCFRFLTTAEKGLILYRILYYSSSSISEKSMNSGFMISIFLRQLDLPNQ